MCLALFGFEDHFVEFSDLIWELIWVHFVQVGVRSHTRDILGVMVWVKTHLIDFKLVLEAIFWFIYPWPLGPPSLLSLILCLLYWLFLNLRHFPALLPSFVAIQQAFGQYLIIFYLGFWLLYVLLLLFLAVFVATQGIFFNTYFEHLFHHLSQMIPHCALLGLLLIVFHLEYMSYLWTITSCLEERDHCTSHVCGWKTDDLITCLLIIACLFACITDWRERLRSKYFGPDPRPPRASPPQCPSIYVL